MTFTAQQIATFVNGTIDGDAQATVTTFARLKRPLQVP